MGRKNMRVGTFYSIIRQAGFEKSYFS